MLVYRPCYPDQKLSHPILTLAGPETIPNLRPRGYINPYIPHTINNMLVADLGDEEVLVTANDNGYVGVWYTKNLLSRSGTMDLFFDVEESAWGLSVHKHKRLIAISANTTMISVYELGSKAIDPRSEPGGPSSPVIFETRGQNLPCISFYQEDPHGRWLSSTDITGNVFLYDLLKQRKAMANYPGQGWTVTLVPYRDFLAVESDEFRVLVEKDKKAEKSHNMHGNLSFAMYEDSDEDDIEVPEDWSSDAQVTLYDGVEDQEYPISAEASGDTDEDEINDDGAHTYHDHLSVYDVDHDDDYDDDEDITIEQQNPMGLDSDDDNIETRKLESSDGSEDYETASDMEVSSDESSGGQARMEGLTSDGRPIWAQNTQAQTYDTLVSQPTAAENIEEPGYNEVLSDIFVFQGSNTRGTEVRINAENDAEIDMTEAAQTAAYGPLPTLVRLSDSPTPSNYVPGLAVTQSPEPKPQTLFIWQFPPKLFIVHSKEFHLKLITTQDHPGRHKGQWLTCVSTLRNVIPRDARTFGAERARYPLRMNIHAYIPALSLFIFGRQDGRVALVRLVRTKPQAKPSTEADELETPGLRARRKHNDRRFHMHTENVIPAAPQRIPFALVGIAASPIQGWEGRDVRGGIGYGRGQSTWLYNNVFREGRWRLALLYSTGEVITYLITAGESHETLNSYPIM